MIRVTLVQQPRSSQGHPAQVPMQHCSGLASPTHQDKRVIVSNRLHRVKSGKQVLPGVERG